MKAAATSQVRVSRALVLLPSFPSTIALDLRNLAVLCQRMTRTQQEGRGSPRLAQMGERRDSEHPCLKQQDHARKSELVTVVH
jgi:hypothetical protein